MVYLCWRSTEQGESVPDMDASIMDMAPSSSPILSRSLPPSNPAYRGTELADPKVSARGGTRTTVVLPYWKSKGAAKSIRERNVLFY